MSRQNRNALFSKSKHATKSEGPAPKRRFRLIGSGTVCIEAAVLAGSAGAQSHLRLFANSHPAVNALTVAQFIVSSHETLVVVWIVLAVLSGTLAEFTFELP